ncbi:MAG TPA: hypothetical protein GXX38_09190 [Clostridia bacterium]|jgi:predicted metal-dependent peptidase|nr:hypothetical protein [Clostridia bacterium]
MKFIEDLTISLLREKPFYAYLLTQMQKIPQKDVPIAAVSLKDGIPQFYYNVSGFEKNCANKKEMLGVIEHELIHLIAGHTVRRGNRQPGIWNLACDFVANQLVSYPLPKIALKVENHDLPLGLAVEEYYELLKKKENRGKGGRSEGKASQEIQNDLGTTNGEMRQTSQTSEGGEQEENEDLNEKYKYLHTTWDDSDELGSELAEALVKEMVKDAYAKSRGEIPQSISHFVKNLVDSRLNWKKIMRMFIARSRAHNRKPTWKKVNRRFPEENPGYKKDYYSNLLVAIDTSGSISSRELSQFAAEIERIQQSKSKITVVECDAAIQKVYELKKKADLDLHFHGRGGTNFNPVFDYVRKSKIKPDAIIYLTDGFGPAPQKPFPIPTLWVITEKGRKPVEWGKEVKLQV